ncbi:CMP-N-acetylneuraminate-beta-galactosamide-alpha-2,3-sialyltransferase 1 [Misgurnus anguillicaudatus]|uniref:CMP-N-acetylneuraminate-beta-galactosamide- alpha-2,3-sialyltransferase 1 n=1 Tax=Misgurnus anguillicaudatus TaxID=75329 RepID=UPI003CCF298F
MAKFLPRLKPHHRRYMILLMSFTIIMCLYFENSWRPLTVNYHVSEPITCINRTCAPDRERTDWFCARYAPTVQLLLNSSNSVLSANVSRWWMRLQNAIRAANYTTLVESLFPLFPDQEHYSDCHPHHRCRSCAVVGNSGNLLESHYGPLIDSNDFVMRINKGPTEGFEEDVGSKTTHRIFYPESAMDLDNSTHLLLSPFKILDIEWLISIFTTKHINKTYMDVPSTINANKDKVMILHPEFMKYVHVNWTENHGRYPSTGFLMVIFALHICDEVNVFGFGATKDGKWHHYFDQTLTPYANESHSGDFEYETIIRLHREKKLLMYKGWT